MRDFDREVAALAAKNGIELPIGAGAENGAREPEHEGDLADLHRRVDLGYRRRNGQFFTPPDVAEFMVRYGIEGGAKTMLDPACGLGVFIDKMLQLSQGRCRIYGIDKDPSMVNACHLEMRERHGERSGEVILRNADYLECEDAEKVDFLACNPPYINFHGFDRRLILRAREESGAEFSMLTNIYALFMARAKRSVRAGGRIAFITPSEFFYTGYGKALKRFLLENFTIDGFVTFDFDSSIFDALTTATVTLMANEKPRAGHRARFVRTRGGLDGITKLPRRSGKRGALVSSIPQKSLDPGLKWQAYFADGAAPGPAADGLVPLGRLADVKRGIATGSNAFFTLSDSERERWGIEDRFLVPAVSRAAQIRGYEVTRADVARLGLRGDRIHLLYCFEAPSPNLSKYIEHGRSEGVDGGYLCSHRSPWYSVERRSAAPVLSTVFSRDNMRFIRNRAGCLNLASYHGVYPRFGDDRLTEALLCYLNSELCAAVQKRARREYGGGLHKFEPGDLLELPAMPVGEIGRKDALKMASLFRKLASSGGAREKLDETVNEIALSLAPDPGRRSRRPGGAV